LVKSKVEKGALEQLPLLALVTAPAPVSMPPKFKGLVLPLLRHALPVKPVGKVKVL
jgi:hypothetical protein